MANHKGLRINVKNYGNDPTAKNGLLVRVTHLNNGESVTGWCSIHNLQASLIKWAAEVGVQIPEASA